MKRRFSTLGGSALQSVQSPAQRRANARRRWDLIRQRIVVGGALTTRPRNASPYASRRTGRAGTWRRRALEAQHARRVLAMVRGSLRRYRFLSRYSARGVMFREMGSRRFRRW